MLTQKELAIFRNYPGDKAELFLQYWTGKEAFLKLWGVGVSLGAVREVVGIGRGAFSGNVRVSFHAARSIG